MKVLANLKVQEKALQAEKKVQPGLLYTKLLEAFHLQTNSVHTRTPQLTTSRGLWIFQQSKHMT